MNTLTTTRRGLIALGVIATTLAIGVAVQAAGDGPPTRAIPYQGRLEFAGNPPSGVHTMTFTLYDDATAGSVLHTEDIDVPVYAGAFSALIGEGGLPDSVYTAAELYLAMAVDGSPLAGRQQIFASHRIVDPPGEFSTGKQTITAAPGGEGGWSIAADYVGPTAGLRYDQGGLLLGLHSNGNLYLADTNNAFTYSMIVEKGPNAGADSYGHGRMNVGSLSLGADSSTVGAIQFGRAGNCDGGGGLPQVYTHTFPTPFANEPVVIVTPNEEDQAGCTEVRLEGVSTNGFTIRSWALGAPFACGCVEWLAIAVP
jgi:hypothetical protein